MSSKDTRVAQRYGDTWTSEDGGRWRSGIETAAIALRAAGYQQVKPRVWHSANTKQARELRCWVSKEWPYACNVEITKL